MGEEKGWCPYFMTRRLINHASILVYNYSYMLDPKVMAQGMVASGGSGVAAAVPTTRHPLFRKKRVIVKFIYLFVFIYFYLLFLIKKYTFLKSTYIFTFF